MYLVTSISCVLLILCPLLLVMLSSCLLYSSRTVATHHCWAQLKRLPLSSPWPVSSSSLAPPHLLLDCFPGPVLRLCHLGQCLSLPCLLGQAQRLSSFSLAFSLYWAAVPISCVWVIVCACVHNYALLTYCLVSLPAFFEHFPCLTFYSCH